MIRLVLINVSVMVILSVLKNFGRVLGSVIFRKIVNCDVLRVCRMLWYFGFNVDRFMLIEMVIGKKLIRKVIRMVLKLCCLMKISVIMGINVVLGIVLKFISNG